MNRSASVMISTAAGTDRLDVADVQRRLKAIFVGSVGNLVEWYDFYAYAAFALYFASSFFPGSDPVVQQLNAAILFAFGFIVRPIGGGVFGPPPRPLRPRPRAVPFGARVVFRLPE